MGYWSDSGMVKGMKGLWYNSHLVLQIFEVPRMKFTELPRRLQSLLAPPDPIVVHHLIKSATVPRCSHIIQVHVLDIHGH